MSDPKQSLDLAVEIETQCLDGQEFAVQNQQFDLMLRENVDVFIDTLDRLEESAAHYKKRADEYRTIASRITATVGKMHDYAKTLILSTPERELQGVERYYKVSRAKPRLVIDERDLPDTFKQTIVEKRPDKAKIEEELNLGNEIPGAHFEESFSLRSYIKRKVAV